MKKMRKIIPAIMCIIAVLLADPYVAFAENEEPETAAKTVRISTKQDENENVDEESVEEEAVEKEDGNSEKSYNYLIERLDVSEMTQVNIGSYEDWVAFARNCSMDTWSKDKYVVITDNIDFNMKEFVPVPYFAGVIEGNGKTFNKIAFNEEDNYIGLISRTAPTAVIRDLDVIGVMKPEGQPFDIGGIVGDNAGMIANCKFEGYVEGYDYIGGIAGYNETTGIISACFVTGKITGLHHVGGICGTNVGLVTGCSSRADINTVTKDVETGIKDIKVEELFTSLINEGKQNDKKMSLRSSNSPVDIGGIVGHNTGEVSSCKSESTVGYEHVGYNIGGIVGRQSGYVHDCTNSGDLKGRKDVGGIVGQAEPYIRLDLNSDIIAQMSTAISKLHDSVDKTIRDTDNSSSVTSARLTVIKNFADSALTDTGYLANSTQDYVNGVVASTNEIVGRLEYVVSETSSDDGPMSEVADAGRHLKQTTENLEEAMKHLDIDEYIEGAEQEEFDRAKSNLKERTEYYNSIYEPRYSDSFDREFRTRYYNRISPTAWVTPPDRPTDDAIKQAEEEAKAAGTTDEQLEQYKNESRNEAAEQASTEAENEADAAYNTKYSSTYESDIAAYSTTIADTVLRHSPDMIDNSTEDGKKAIKNAEKMANDLKDAGKDMKSILRSVANSGSVRFPQLSDEYRMRTNSLVANIQGMSDNLGFLNSEMRGSTETVCKDLESVNDDFSSLLLLMTDAMDGALDMDYSDVFEDESDDVCEESIDATITKCQNNGSIYADINTGGIAGTMAQEYDFDLEGDLTGIKNAAKKSTYRTKCVLRNNVNRGRTKGKKSYVGGVCGLHEIGTILRCDNFAKVSSESGDYVGGICGRSYSTIRNCREKGVLSGGSHIGGITGAAEDILDCIAMPTIAEGTSFTGAIAGEANEGGKIARNEYVNDSLAGIDRISREGGAYPVSYSELLSRDDITSDFTRIKIDFIVDDKIVASLSKRSGEVITPAETPVEAEVAKKENKKKKDDTTESDGKIILQQDEYIDWDCDEEITVYEDTEISGRVRRYTTTLSSDQVAENKQSIFLVDGRFVDGDRLVVEEGVKNEVLEEYVLKIPNDRQPTHLVRYQIPDNSVEEKIFVGDGKEYTEVAVEEYGDYYTFETTGNEVHIRIDKRDVDDILDVIVKYLKIAGGIIAGLIVLKVILWRIRKKRRKTQKQKRDKKPEDKPEEKQKEQPKKKAKKKPTNQDKQP